MFMLGPKLQSSARPSSVLSCWVNSAGTAAFPHAFQFDKVTCKLQLMRLHKLALRSWDSFSRSIKTSLDPCPSHSSLEALISYVFFLIKYLLNTYCILGCGDKAVKWMNDQALGLCSDIAYIFTWQRGEGRKFLYEHRFYLVFSQCDTNYSLKGRGKFCWERPPSDYPAGMSAFS